MSSISVIDPGTPVAILAEYLRQNHSFITHYKFAWGSSLLFKNELDEKVNLLENYGIKSYCGGSLFELAHISNEIDNFKSFLKKFRLKTVEISSGSIQLSADEIKNYVNIFSSDFEVIVEIGKKDQSESELMYPEIWIKEINNALDSGASNIILEGRESGTSGIYRSNGELRRGLILEIASNCPLDKLIFECSRKAEQLQLIKLLNNSIGFGNIPMNEVASLVALLSGLRGDTISTETKLDWGI